MLVKSKKTSQVLPVFWRFRSLVFHSFVVLRVRFGFEELSSVEDVRDSSVGGAGGSGTTGASTSLIEEAGITGTAGTIGAGIPPPPGMRPFNLAK